MALVLNLLLAVAITFYDFSLSTGAAVEALTLIVATIVLVVVSLFTQSSARERITDDIRRVIES